MVQLRGICRLLDVYRFHLALQEGSRAPNAKHDDNLKTGGDFDGATTYGGQYIPKVRLAHCAAVLCVYCLSRLPVYLTVLVCR